MAVLMQQHSTTILMQTLMIIHVLLLVLGCMNPQAFNYDPSANTDNDSCVAVVNGCTDATAFNYNPNANTDDNSCIAIVLGCMNPQAFNYDPSANTDNLHVLLL